MMSRDEPSEVDESNVQELEHYLKELYFLGFLRFREADSGRVSTKVNYRLIVILYFL